MGKRVNAPIWIDYMAPCDVFFFRSLADEFANISRIPLIETARSHAETIGLLRSMEKNVIVRGTHRVSSLPSQLASIMIRDIKLTFSVPNFGLSVSLANLYGVTVAKIRGRPSVTIIDNDLIENGQSIFEKVPALIHAKADYIIAPRCYPTSMTIANGANPERIFTFDGFKEDIYVATHSPNKSILDELPFDEYIILRPEALYASYVHEKVSITTELLYALTKAGLNVVYLPRNEFERRLAPKSIPSKQIFLPRKALNGLDLAFFSSAVLTGSGTFAREAACMGRPSISFFPDRLLAVDAELIRQGKMIHSRNIQEICTYIEANMSKNTHSSERSIKARLEFIDALKSCIIEVTT